MTKKHFIALADAIRKHDANCVENGHCPFPQSCIEDLADFCESLNSEFNRKRWLDYVTGKCGSNGGKL